MGDWRWRQEIFTAKENAKGDKFSEIKNRNPSLLFASTRVHSRLLLVLRI